jgi:hypothetical protein
MHKVFISYSRNDEGQVQEIANLLMRHGIPVWLDTNELGLGDDWIKAMGEAITQSDLVLLLCSPNIAESVWVATDLQEAAKHYIRILPVVIEGEPEAVIPPSLQRARFVDFRQRDATSLKLLIDQIGLIAA